MDKKERLTLNIPECAKLLGISRGAAYDLAAQGKGIVEGEAASK